MVSARRALYRGAVGNLTDRTEGPPCAECGAPVVMVANPADPAYPEFVCSADWSHDALGPDED